MREKSVLFIVENLPVPFDRRVWLEATTLARAGYRVSVICPAADNYSAFRESQDGVEIYRHPLPLEANSTLGYVIEYGAALFWEISLAIRLSFTRGFSVIHACNPPDTIFLIGAFFKLFGKRFLFDHHDLSPEVFESKFGRRGVRYKVLRVLEWLTFRTADVVISTNESYRDIAINRGKVKPSQVFVVRSGPDLSRWPKDTTPDPAWRNGRAFMVGYVGVMGAQEGLDLLLMSARYLVFERGRTDIQFVLVGNGPERAKLEALSRKFGLSDHVSFTGRLDDTRLLSMLATADVCVNPDRFSTLNDRSTMNKIVEYMASGKPIVQYDLHEGRVSAQDASLYAKPGDSKDFADQLATLLDNPERRARMGAAGRLRVETALAWSHQEKNLFAAYDRLLAD